ncbi:hypothetical protein FDECE_13109 [Fusarium decemcellulare]|nr:hypothetical protein FDECE_13109 [Fusarium decemcellulare]
MILSPSPRAVAVLLRINSVAAAPSETWLELPAVEAPSGLKAGLSLASASMLTFSLMPSSAVTVGCDPDEMGIGPAIAIPKLLSQVGLKTEDVSRWEINEAFASQALYCVRELGLEDAWAKEKVNPDGGAIALGHPLGATGARMTSTLMHGLERDGGEVGVVSMCVGTGMGMAGLFVRE